MTYWTTKLTLDGSNPDEPIYMTAAFETEVAGRKGFEQARSMNFDHQVSLELLNPNGEVVTVIYKGQNIEANL